MSGWKEIRVLPRHTSRRMKVAIRGSVIKVLNELITNSDDSYYRLEKQGKETSGLIQIGFRRKKKRKRLAIREFYVRDYAEGIPLETLEEKFGEYGGDTAGSTRRGCFGQGAKDALCNMTNSVILSIYNGQVGACKIMMINGVPKYFIEDEKTAHRLLQSFNDKTKNAYSLIPTQNGTFVYFEIPPDQNSPRASTLVQTLQSFSMLRKILSDPQRRVQLIDHKTGKISELNWIPITGEILLSDQFTISFNSMNFKIDLTVIDAQADLDQSLSDKREGGLLVVDEDDAVLDLTLFGYDEEASAASLTGEVRIVGFKTLFRKDESVITETRDGLDYRHRFNQLLKAEVRKRLEEIVTRLSREKAEKETFVDKKLDRQIKSAFVKINSLMKKEAEVDLEGSGEVEKEEKKPKLGMEFSPYVVHIESGQIRTVHLLVDPEKVPLGATISVSCDNSNIDVVPTGPIVVPENLLSEELIRIPLNITGERPGDKGVVTASYRLVSASLFVTITEIIEVIPPSGFDFVPDRVRVYEGKTTHLKLLVDTKVVHPAVLVSISSDNPHIIVKSGKIGNEPVENPEMFPIPRLNSGSLLVVAIKIEGRKANEKGTITAKVPGRETQAVVKVIQKKPPGGFFKGYKLDPEKDPRQRFSFDRKSGMIYVHIKAPVLEKYLGTSVEYLRKEKKSKALVMLAEVILRCICRQWAKCRFETGYKEYINFGDPAAMREEEESEARQIDYQFGPQIHDWILGEYAEEQ